MSRLVDLCLKSGMAGFPRKARDRHILLKAVVLTLDAVRQYTERELNDSLQFWLTDIARSIDFDRVALRRLMVDEGYLQRDRAGSTYRVCDSDSGEYAFESDVDRVDVYEAIGLAIKAIQAKRRGRSTAQSGWGGHAV